MTGLFPQPVSSPQIFPDSQHLLHLLYKFTSPLKYLHKCPQAQVYLSTFFFSVPPRRNYVSLCIFNNLTKNTDPMLQKTGSTSAVSHKKFPLSQRESLQCISQIANSCNLFLSSVIGFYVTSREIHGKSCIKTSESCCLYEHLSWIPEEGV